MRRFNNRLRIVIDGRLFNESGIGRYIRNLTAGLQKLDQENEYFILLREHGFHKIKLTDNFHKYLTNVYWYGISEQLKLPKILNGLKPDLVHFPHFNVPILYGGKFIVTIHDLIHQHYQMRRATLHDPITYKIKQLGYKTVFKNAVSKAVKILTPSNYVRDLLVKEWKIEETKITVTYEAVDDKLITAVTNLSDVKAGQDLEKFSIKSPYIFYVGNAHPHKNVEGLIKTFLKLKEKQPDLKLVLSGYDHYFWQRIKSQYQDRSITYTGLINDDELVALYKNANVFVIPSFEEGFGIPLLEAMACGCPVVSSNAGALPEIGGNAAIYFDPKDKGDMENKIDQVLNSDELKKELVEKGKKRHQQFSWKKLAEQTLEVYEKCA